MLLTGWVKKHTTDIGYYFLTILLTLVILEFVARLTGINWHIPLSYGVDTDFYLTYIKTLVKGEWFPFISNVKSSFLAAPFGLELADWPTGDGLFYMIIRFIGLFFNDYIVVYNVYFFLTFFLSSTLFVFAARQFDIDYPIAIVCGILFAFQPYHFARLPHLFLASYFIIPLMTVILIWIWDVVPIFFIKSGDNLKMSLNNRRAIFTAIVVILSAWSGINYVFFFCFFVVVASLSAYLNNSKSHRHLISGGIIIGMIILFFMLNFLPNFIYFFHHGFDNQAFYRYPLEAEMYGLRIIGLFVPLVNHRVDSLQALMKEYNFVLHPEMLGSYLGLIAGLALLFLIFRFVLIGTKECIHDRLSVLSIAGILLSTVSGFGLIFAFLVSPNIRGYSRISIFLASFALFSVAFWMNNCAKGFNKKAYAILILCMIMIIGVLDQTADFHPIEKDEFVSDSLFVHEIEKQAGANGSIFQLPFVPFPESNAILDMREYSHAKGYLHSDTLHWVYGSPRGRPAADWYESMAKLPSSELLNKLSVIGFSGIYIDRYAYADRAKSLEGEFTRILHVQPLVSKNMRLSYFNINPYREDYNSQFSTSTLAQLNNSYLRLPPAWINGAYFIETSGKDSWRWCQKKCTLVFSNQNNSPLNVGIKMQFSSIHPENSKLIISTDSSKDEIIINNDLTEFHKSFFIAPGKEYAIKFEAEAKSIIPPPDVRYLDFRVINFEFKMN